MSLATLVVVRKCSTPSKYTPSAGEENSFFRCSVCLAAGGLPKKSQALARVWCIFLWGPYRPGSPGPGAWARAPGPGPQDAPRPGPGARARTLAIS